MLDTNNAGSVVLTRPNLKLVPRVSHEWAVPLLKMSSNLPLRCLFLSYARVLALEMFFTEVYTLLFTDVLFCGNISHFLVC